MDEDIKNQEEPQRQDQTTHPEGEHSQSDQPQGESEQAQPTQPVEEKAALSSEAKNMGMLCHLLGLFGFIGPLIVWLIEKDKFQFVNENGKAALNWQISLVIYFFASWVLAFIFIGLILMPLLVLLNIIFVVLAAVKASSGETYTYPLAIKFLK